VSIKLFETSGGSLTLPDRSSLLLDRLSGGNLVVLPPRKVWERTELTREELMNFSFLVASCAKAMLDTLPQLQDGCINYWEAGNWAVNDQSEPIGKKKARDFRKMHLHLLGRNPNSVDPRWQWGESPEFPKFAQRHTYSTKYERLTPDECWLIVSRANEILRSQYNVAADAISEPVRCKHCSYPAVTKSGLCEES
jgi:hypothetical protein